jgi:hypothetical protein
MRRSGSWAQASGGQGEVRPAQAEEAGPFLVRAPGAWALGVDRLPGALPGPDRGSPGFPSTAFPWYNTHS